MENESKEQTPEISAPSSNQSAKRFITNVLMVLFSNALTVVSGLLVGFVIPKIMGVSEYGYYKSFTLYCSYIGLFHLGFIDGIYLYYAGKNYEELDKHKFRTYTRFLILSQIFVTMTVVAVAMFFINSEYCLIILLVAASVISTNVCTYYEFVTQLTMKFKLLSIRSTIRCIVTIVSIGILYALYRWANVKIYFYIYAIIILATNYLLTFWYAITYRDITFGKGIGFKAERKNISLFYKIGIPLLCANLVAQLVFVIDQQCVNIFFDNDTYSTYAFAYSMINLITIATSAISVVLYPTLKQMSEEKVKSEYATLNGLLLIFVSAGLIAYFFLVPFVNHFLKEYSESLKILRIVMPGILISSSISVIKYNCYKKFNRIRRYFVKSLIVLVLAFEADIVAFYVIGTTESISIVSIIVLLIWYILTEFYFIRKYKAKWLKNFCYLLLILATFYGSTFMPEIWIQLIVYVGGYIIITAAMYFKEIYQFIAKFKNRKKIQNENNEEV